MKELKHFQRRISGKKLMYTLKDDGGRYFAVAIVPTGIVVNQADSPHNPVLTHEQWKELCFNFLADYDELQNATGELGAAFQDVYYVYKTDEQGKPIAMYEIEPYDEGEQ